MAIFSCLCRDGAKFISKPFTSSLLYQNRGCCANNDYNKNRTTSCTYGDFGEYGSIRTIFYYMTKNGVILTRKIGTKSHEKNI